MITGLRVGGAETMLFKLLQQFRADGGPDGAVINLSGPAPMAAPIDALGVAVTNIGMSPGTGAFLKLSRLRSAIADTRPDIVQCWMYHANLMGALALRGRPRTPLIWGLRQSDLDPHRSKRRTVLVARVGARLSASVPDRIVCVSGSARDVHVALGYDAGKMLVIPNGFDLEVFRPDPIARQEIRAEVGIRPENKVVGLVARHEPQKDHGTFITAAKIIAEQYPETTFVLCGEGANETSKALTRVITAAGLSDRFRLLGCRKDIQRITATFDVAVSSSGFGEGFSNALGEALCCAVPAVATDVGEARALVGDAGRIVPPGDPGAMAAAITELLALGPAERNRLGQVGRTRMARNYAMSKIADRYIALYDAMLVAKR